MNRDLAMSILGLVISIIGIVASLVALMGLWILHSRALPDPAAAPGHRAPEGPAPRPTSPSRLVCASAAGPGSPSFPGSRRVVLRMRVTAYCPCRRCCGRFSDGVTASGLPVSHNRGRFAAGPPEIPFGTFVAVPGYPDGTGADGRPVPVIDRGAAVRGDRLEVFFPTHDAALRWGVQWLDVEILEASRHETKGAADDGK